MPEKVFAEKSEIHWLFITFKKSDRFKDVFGSEWPCFENSMKSFHNGRDCRVVRLISRTDQFN